LAIDRKAAHSLAQDVVDAIPEARERQVYKLIYPFVFHQCYPQANFILKQHVIQPATENGF